MSEKRSCRWLLVDREVYGPSNLGAGLVDGIAFDAYGNPWATMIFADRLVAITPEGDLLELLEDGDPAATARFEVAFATGATVPFDVILACGGPICNWLASITFGGPALLSRRSISAGFAPLLEYTRWLAFDPTTMAALPNVS